MAKKALPTKKNKRDKIGNYFLKDKENLVFVSTGCSLVDRILGGGMPMGRVINLIGDSHCGKTLLAIEVGVNFQRMFPKGIIEYHEGEGAFDEPYAKELGLDLSKVNFVDTPKGTKDTLEDLAKRLSTIIKEKEKLRKSKSKEDKAKADEPVMYVVDSYDSLNLDKETENTDKGYVAAKCAQRLGEILKDNVNKLAKNNIMLLIISQTRVNISDNPYAPPIKRNGGAALKFYSTQEIWLSESGKMAKTFIGKEWKLGLRIMARTGKNRVGIEYRHCFFYIRFGFGVDDIRSNLEYIKDYGNLEKIDTSGTDIDAFKTTNLEEQVRKVYQSEHRTVIAQRIADEVERRWWEIEEKLFLDVKKY